MRIATLAVGAGAAAATVPYLVVLLNADPLAGFRDQNRAMDRNRVTITMSDAEVKHYSGGSLVANASVAKVEVTQDRQTLRLIGISDGVYRRNADQRFEFQAKQGSWNQSARLLQVDGGTRVWNEDIDLRTEAFFVNEATHVLTAPNPVKGKFFDGTLDAAALSFNLEDERYNVTRVAWVGTLNLEEAAQQPPARNADRWDIKADSVQRGRGDIETWRKAQATDGDIIVTADLVERNVKTDVLVATGNVKYFGKDADLICEKVTVYRREKRAVLEGNVSMLVKPEDQPRPVVDPEIRPVRPVVPEQLLQERPAPPPEPGEDDPVRDPDTARQYPMTVLAKRIEYWYAEGSRRAHVTGEPQARQELPEGRWRQMWAHEAFYDGEAETLRLVSREGQKDVRMLNSIGDDLRAFWFVFSTEEDVEAYEGAGVEGVVFPDDEDLRRRNREGGEAPPGLQGPIGPRS